MLDKNDIEIIAGLLEKQSADFDRRLEKQSADFDRKLEQMREDIHTDFTAILESSIQPKINILIDGHKTILQMLTPRQEIEDMKAEISILRDAVKYLSAKVQALESKVS